MRDSRGIPPFEMLRIVGALLGLAFIVVAVDKIYTWGASMFFYAMEPKWWVVCGLSVLLLSLSFTKFMQNFHRNDNNKLP